MIFRTNAVFMEDAEASDHQHEHVLHTVGAWITIHLQRCQECPEDLQQLQTVVVKPLISQSVSLRYLQMERFTNTELADESHTKRRACRWIASRTQILPMDRFTNADFVDGSLYERRSCRWIALRRHSLQMYISRLCVLKARLVRSLHFRT